MRVIGVVHVFDGKSFIIARAYEVSQLFSLISGDDHHAPQPYGGELREQTVDECDAIHAHHAFRVLFCECAEAFTHARGQNDCLHSAKV